MSDGRPRLSAEQRRTRSLHVFVTDSEGERLQAAAREAGLSLSTLMRAGALDLARRGREATELRGLEEEIIALILEQERAGSDDDRWWTANEKMWPLVKRLDQVGKRESGEGGR